MKGFRMSLVALADSVSANAGLPRQQLVGCPEWRIILEQYRAAARNYSQAVLSLSAAHGESFNDVWMSAERARKACELFRASLLDHEHDHCCLTGN
jgi:hypothetical protein